MPDELRDPGSQVARPVLEDAAPDRGGGGSSHVGPVDAPVADVYALTSVAPAFAASAGRGAKRPSPLAASAASAAVGPSPAPSGNHRSAAGSLLPRGAAALTRISRGNALLAIVPQCFS